MGNGGRHTDWLLGLPLDNGPEAKATCAKALLPNAAIWAAADRHRALRWQKQLAARKPEDKLNDVAKSVTTVVPAYTLLVQRI